MTSRGALLCTSATTLAAYLAEKQPARAAEAVLCVVAWLSEGHPDARVGSSAVRRAYPRGDQLPPGLPRIVSSADALRSAGRIGVTARVGREVEHTRETYYQMTAAGYRVLAALPDRRAAAAARRAAADVPPPV